MAKKLTNERRKNLWARHMEIMNRLDEIEHEYEKLNKEYHSLIDENKTIGKALRDDVRARAIEEQKKQ